MRAFRSPSLRSLALQLLNIPPSVLLSPDLLTFAFEWTGLSPLDLELLGLTPLVFESLGLTPFSLESPGLFPLVFRSPGLRPLIIESTDPSPLILESLDFPPLILESLGFLALALRSTDLHPSVLELLGFPPPVVEPPGFTSLFPDSLILPASTQAFRKYWSKADVLANGRASSVRYPGLAGSPRPVGRAEAVADAGASILGRLRLPESVVSGGPLFWGREDGDGCVLEERTLTRPSRRACGRWALSTERAA